MRAMLIPFLILSWPCIGQQSSTINFQHNCKTIDSLYILDQRYRHLISSESKQDTVLFGDRNVQNKLQAKIDSSNRDILFEMLTSDGWSFKKCRIKAKTLIMHAIDSIQWFNTVDSILLRQVKLKRMPAQDYADLVDRSLLISRSEELYHTGYYRTASGQVLHSRPKNFEKTNHARIHLGLKPLNPKAKYYEKTKATD